MNLQERFNDARRAYVYYNLLSHEDFYEWLGLEIGAQKLPLPVSLERIRQSTDPYLNDIPLVLWDRQDAVVRRAAVSHGMRYWSLCDTVCVMKNEARRRAAKP